MDKEDIGKIIRAMPFVNEDEVFDDVTMDYDTANNIILALDRGERPEPHSGENHKYMIKRLFSRTMKADFQFLPDEVKEDLPVKFSDDRRVVARPLCRHPEYVDESPLHNLVQRFVSIRMETDMPQ